MGNHKHVFLVSINVDVQNVAQHGRCRRSGVRLIDDGGYPSVDVSVIDDPKFVRA